MKTSGFAATLALLCSAATADVVDIAWNADGRYEGSLSAAPGAFAELCGHVAAGSRIDWTFESSGATDFDIHFHAGKRVEYAAREAGVATGSGTLRAASGQDYCWMWANGSGRPVTVRVRLGRLR